jgi:hypothetical protein
MQTDGLEIRPKNDTTHATYGELMIQQRFFLVSSSFILAVLTSITTTSIATADWSQFRGPQGNAVSTDANLPTKWSDKENVVWRTELPGLGTSSPILVGENVYVTCYSGYAENVDSPGSMDDLKRHVICVDRVTGKIRWKVDVQPKLPESEYSGGNNSWHGYSSSTPVSDGKNLFVFFGATGVFCYDLNGKEIWKSSVGTRVTGWGSGTSPVLHENLVIVNASVESGSLVALDKASGKEVWRMSGIRGPWNTPLLVNVPGGKTELLLSLPKKIIGVDPLSGKELWNCEGIPDDGYVCPSAVSHDGIVYLIGGRKNTAIAVRAGGSGNVTESHRLWKVDVGSNVSSPVYYEGHLYWVHERQAILNCLNAKTGEVVYQKRIEPRPGVVYASIVAAGGRLYSVSQHNGVYVFAAKPEFELITRNVFADDDSRANASPAVDRGQIFLRNDKFLYCIGGTRQSL